MTDNLVDMLYIVVGCGHRKLNNDAQLVESLKSDEDGRSQDEMSKLPA
jgi:hypothetical protein